MALPIHPWGTMRHILVVDDHPMMLDAVRRVFEPSSDEWAVSEALSYTAAVERMSTAPMPDLVLLDLGLPGKFGLDALRAFRAEFPEVPCVVLSGQDGRDAVVGAIDLGAMGFISKRSTGADLMEAIGLVQRGYVCIPKESVSHASQSANPKAGLHPLELGLTNKQCEVLAQLILGKSNKVIARALSLSEATIKTHLLAIYRVLNVNSRTGAVIAVNKLGLQLSLFDRTEK